MAMNPNFTPGFRSGPKQPNPLGGLIGSFRNVQNPVDFNAQAMQLAGNPGASGQRGLLGQQLSGGGSPDVMVDPASLPGGVDRGRADQIRNALGMSPFPNQVPFRDTIDFIRMWEQQMGNRFTPMGGDSPFWSGQQGAGQAMINPASLPGRGLI